MQYIHLPVGILEIFQTFFQPLTVIRIERSLQQNLEPVTII